MEARVHNMPIQEEKAVRTRISDGGFTVIEIIVVMVIIAIAAVLVVPMMSSAGDMQIQCAANMIAGDLEYAKSMAISRQQRYSVIFNTAGDYYEVCDASGAVIKHPVKKGFDYVVRFHDDSRLDRVDIASVNFNGTGEVEFDYLGCPYDGNGSSLNIGSVTMQAGEAKVIVSVEPITGFITISK